MNFFKKSFVIMVSLITIFIVGILIGISVFAFLQNNKENKVYIKKNKAIKEKSLLRNKIDTIKQTSNIGVSQNKNITIPPSGFNQQALFVPNQDIVIFKGDVKWESPKELENLGLTMESIYVGCASAYNHNVKSEDACPKGGGESLGVKYIKVGLILKGKFKNYEIIFVRTGYSEGPGGDDLLIMLKKGKDVTFLLDDNTSYMAEVLGKYFNNGDYNIKAMSGVKFEELFTPEIINDSKTGAKFIKNKYEQAFFDNTNLQVAFQHPIYGTVWITKPVNSKESKLELNSYKEYDYKNKKFVKKYEDIFDDNGFYIKLPNGMAVSYKLILSDITESQKRFGIINATWNDGTINDVSYELNPSGCGSTSYIYNETGVLNIKTDLTPIGKTNNGKTLYGFRDISTKDFKKLYKDIYHARDGEKKTESEFLLIHPKVFYLDPYNRLIAFYRADILSPAECGKPVIYLYPEEPLNVNVQVKPNQGISISEPKYPKNGWDVLARPSGELTFKSNKYPYLFWEGSSDVSYEQSRRGWVVKKENLNSFLNSKLVKLGLIQKEINDFKEFWLPEMIKNNKPYYFITFLPQQKIDQLAPLTITPNPQTVIRVMMDYRELDQEEETIGFEIKTPRRKGFTVVEWGGMLKGGN